MTPMKSLLSVCALLALPAFLACGGGSSTPPPPPTASSLAYTDPASGTYKLVKNPASSGAHLVLDLVGPSTGTAMGVSLTLTGDAKTTWTDIPAGVVTPTVFLQNGSQFNLGTGTPIQKAKATGTVLQATVAQKAPTAEASLNGTLLRVALDLKPNQGLPQGTVLTLDADNAKSQVLAGGTLSPIIIRVGTLKAQ